MRIVIYSNIPYKELISQNKFFDVIVKPSDNQEIQVNNDLRFIFNYPEPFTGFNHKKAYNLLKKLYFDDVIFIILLIKGELL